MYIRVSQVNGCAFYIDMHTQDALNAWRETPFFSPRERAALTLCEEMTNLPTSNVPDDVYEEAARHFEPKELALLIWTITIVNAWNRIAITSRMVPGSYPPRSVD